MQDAPAAGTDRRDDAPTVRGLTRRWRLAPASDAAGPDGPGLLDRIVAARGLPTGPALDDFLAAKLTGLHDPSAMPGIDAAAERILAALADRERIAIYGDYDVDGITATAILYHLLDAIDPEASRTRLVTYVPHRLEEGYGLNAVALEGLAAEGVRLVVTVDCGVNAIEPVAAGVAAGLDLIVTDHHNPPAPGDPLPDAILVHPRAPGSTYPCGELCGAGVAFKLAWAIARRHAGSERVGADLQRRLMDLLPLAALGTIADVVPLVDENRLLVKAGLGLLGGSPFAGVQALLHCTELVGAKVDTEQVGFILGPRLNACGRLGHARDAVHLFTRASAAEAAEIAEQLGKQNRERQQVERRIADEAARRAEAEGMTGDDVRAIVLADRDWHPGVIGIACSRLVERFGRPVVLMREEEDGTCRGSARSIDAYSIHAGLVATAEHLERFGGHDVAAGLVVRAGALDAFRDALVAHANERLEPDDLVPGLAIDADATIPEVTLGEVERIARLAPFGRGNPRPVVRLVDARIAEPPRLMGKDGRHLQVRLADAGGPGSGAASLRAVWWSQSEQLEHLAEGRRVEVAVELKVDEWQGRRSVQAVIRDLRLAGTPSAEMIEIRPAAGGVRSSVAAAG